MNIRFSTAFAAMGCILLASCYPYNENRGRKETGKPPEKTVSSADQQKIQAQRDKLKQDELKKKEANTLPSETVGNGNGESPTTTVDAGTSGTTDTAPKPPAEKKRDYAFASKVPGKEGFVFSPYNNKIIDVRDMPSGTLVSDPTYPESEKKYFRVP